VPHGAVGKRLIVVKVPFKNSAVFNATIQHKRKQHQRQQRETAKNNVPRSHSNSPYKLSDHSSVCQNPGNAVASLYPFPVPVVAHRTCNVSPSKVIPSGTISTALRSPC